MLPDVMLSVLPYSAPREALDVGGWIRPTRIQPHSLL